MSKRIFVAGIEVLSDRNATVAYVSLFDEKPKLPMIRVTGSTKREPGDVYDEAIAMDLAVGRALSKLGRKLQRRGTNNVTAATQEQNKTRVLAAIRKTQRRVRVEHPERVLLPLDDIKNLYGKKAARRAASRRGVSWPTPQLRGPGDPADPSRKS